MQPVSIVTLETASLVVDGGAGNDNLTVDDSGGQVTIPITYNGGAGTNALTLTGSTAATADLYVPGSQLGAGTSTLTFASGGPEVVNFLNLAPVIDEVAGPLTVTGTNGNDAISYAADPAIAGNGLISVNNLETISFLNKTNVTIDTLAGQDTVSVANTTDGMSGNLNVDGGDPAAGDQLIVNGATATTLAVNTATEVVTGGGPTQIDYANMAGITANAGDVIGSPSLAVAGEASYVYTPAAAADAGTVLAGVFPIAFTGVASGQTLSLTGSVGTATLAVNGTAANDAFTVAATTGDVTETGRLTIAPTSIGVLTLNGLGGENTFGVTAPQSYTTIEH